MNRAALKRLTEGRITRNGEHPAVEHCVLCELEMPNGVQTPASTVLRRCTALYTDCPLENPAVACIVGETAGWSVVVNREN